MKHDVESVFISGVSSGIGLALATLYLSKGWVVYGLSRKPPQALMENKNFKFKHCDLLKIQYTVDFFEHKFSPIREHGVSIVYLNAGVSGGTPKFARDVTVEDIQDTMFVNVIANKLLLDAFMSLPKRPKVCVASASIAGIRFRAGMLPYSLSKSALLALFGTYANEFTDVFFAAIGMCNVDTELSREIVFNPRAAKFHDHVALQKKFNLPNYVVSPEKRAGELFSIVNTIPENGLSSGQFIEIRDIISRRD